MSQGERDTAVVHLVRKGNPADLLRRFIASYKRHGAGAAHRLVIAFKGYGGGLLPGDVEEALEGIDADRRFYDDAGFDLTVYRAAAEELEGFDFLYFFNSYSVIQSDRWLEKTRAWALLPDVGLAGAMGSAFSISSAGLEEWLKNSLLFRENPLRLPARLKEVLSGVARFPAHPNFHVRTNAFMMRREDWLSLDFPSLRTKADAWAFESGRRGLSRQVERKGKTLCVVGADGKGYFPAEWARSNTFHGGDQGNLMVRDNQTERYAAMGEEDRAWMSRVTWSNERVLGVTIPSRLRGLLRGRKA